MFLPAINPADVVGQSLRIAAQYIGAAVIPLLDKVYTGFLFRVEQTVFVMYCEHTPTGAELRIQPIEAGQAVEILELSAKNQFLAKSAAAALQQNRELSQTIQNLQAAYEDADKRRQQIYGDWEKLGRDYSQVFDDCHQLRSKLARYENAVGPLDDFPVEPNPAQNVIPCPEPPPVVSASGGAAGDTTISMEHRAGRIHENFRRLMFLEGLRNG